MDQIYVDIFRKLALYIAIAKEFKDEIEVINVRNEIEEYFGKKYCRVYIDIKLNAESNKHYKFQQTFFEKFFKYCEKEYFSFYLTSDHKSSEAELRNESENTHYDYIWNLLTWYLESSKIKVEAAFFKSQQHLKYERERWNREYELKQIALRNAVSNFTPEVGLLVAIKEWRDSPVRIGKIENVILPNKRQAFSIDVLEVKTDFTAGKRKINIWSKEKINAVIQPQKLQSGISKSELIGLIERNEKFDGLIWRMPQELWD